uniref:SMODS and SLOG-associating 2TM effector domain-containing protein n=1 Tax=Pyramimonas orientalis virus TaxID=455367 RepID=A0A7M3UPE5_POV01|nr:hypothetical protein HWQ62_00501 [Pyramimonas orientalis virus]
MPANENGEQSCDEDTISESMSTKMNNIEQWEFSNTETLLQEWGEKAAGLRWMHRYSANHWRSVDKRLNLVGISLSSFVSASSLIGAAEDIVPSTYIMTVVGFVGMLNILNQSLMRFYNSNEKITLHENAAKGFGNINRLIATKLSMSRRDRGNPKTFLNYILKENEKLFNDNIEPHTTSINAFLNTFNKKNTTIDFNFPDIVGKSFRIRVCDTETLFNNTNKSNNYKVNEQELYQLEIEPMNTLNMTNELRV